MVKQLEEAKRRKLSKALTNAYRECYEIEHITV